MTRREKIKIYLGMIKADAPLMDPETIRIAVELMWDELRALWAVVEAVDEQRQCEGDDDLYPGVLDALDSYNASKEGGE